MLTYLKWSFWIVFWALVATFLHYTLPQNDLIQSGASPRATINLTIASKANAFLEGRAYVIPQDVKEIAMDVLRHRVILTYEAEAEEKTPEDLIQEVLRVIPVP